MRMDPEDVTLLVRLLRALRRWSQEELGARAGIERASILRIENGTVRPSGQTVERLIAAVGLPVDVALGILPPVIRLLRGLMTPDPGRTGMTGDAVPDSGLREEDLLGDLKVASGAAFSVLASALAVADSAGRVSDVSLPLADTHALPTLTERLCVASVQAASHDAADAVQLARLAVRAAPDAEGPAALRTQLEGWARAFLANGLRVSGRLPEAEVEFAAAWRLWRAGQNGDPDCRLPEWRLLDLEASLRRDQMRTTEALALLQQARGSAPRAVVGRLLVNAACALERAGEISEALEVLREAMPLVAEYGDQRASWCVTLNLAVNLCHLERYEEARQWADEAGALASKLGNDLDRLRVAWLSARVDAGMGHSESARAALAEVRDDLVRRRDALDAAIVSLEIAVIDLAAGRTAQVKALAGEMAWIFSSEGFERDALVALQLFCKAALRETVTLAQAQALIARLQKSQPPVWVGQD